MNKRQKIEENILNDLYFGAKTYGFGPEYKQKVREYFEMLLRQVEQNGSIRWNDGTVIECTPELVRHYARRYM